MTGFWTLHPVNQQQLQFYPYASSQDIDQALDELNRGYAFSQTEKQKLLRSLAESLLLNIDRLARLISMEMGKPYLQSKAEVQKSASVCLWVADELDHHSESEMIQNPSGRVFHVQNERLGVLFAIMPWNFPVWQTLRILPVALACGNSVLLKPAEQTTGTSLELERIIHEVIGPGFFKVLALTHERARDVICDPRVQAVTLTGSTRAGREVGRLCGENLKKSVLELGGMDPYFILEDADLELSALKCAVSKLVNNGQSCISAKRFFVPRPRLEAWSELFVEHLKSFKIGDPFAPGTQLGPLVSLAAKARILDQVNSLKAHRARPLWIGPELEGAYLSPQVWVVKGHEPTFIDDEVFGPVAQIYAYDSEDEAWAVAQKSPYGLGAGVFSQDLERARKFGGKLKAGLVALNDFVQSDPWIPFEGRGWSGFGKELGRQSFFEFAPVKVFMGPQL